jgi:predicted RNase H-like nuclease (RuvC/YqgF family)
MFDKGKDPGDAIQALREALARDSETVKIALASLTTVMERVMQLDNRMHTLELGLRTTGREVTEVRGEVHQHGQEHDRLIGRVAGLEKRVEKGVETRHQWTLYHDTHLDDLDQRLTELAKRVDALAGTVGNPVPSPDLPDNLSARLGR